MSRWSAIFQAALSADKRGWKKRKELTKKIEKKKNNNNNKQKNEKIKKSKKLPVFKNISGPQ